MSLLQIVVNPSKGSIVVSAPAAPQTIQLTAPATPQVVQLGTLSGPVNQQITQAVTNSAASATAAAGSATAAAGSAAAASSSASAASTSAASASNSASSATTSAGTATTQASNAAASASSAATSATNAGTSATAAAGSASTATTQASNASASASASATSATSASGSASAAATSASNASASASTASTAASTATTQATNAAGSATAAASSATASANAYSAIANGTATDAGAPSTWTGNETVPLSRGAGLLQTTLAKVATFCSGVALVWKAGGVGAIARTLLAKLADLPLSVTDFGAKGDGTPYVTTGGTDNTAAINNALTAASSLGFSAVVFPDSAGVYNVSGAIYLQPGVWVRGLGGRPKINLTASATNVIDSNVNVQLTNQGWDNVDILCNSLANAGFYIHFFKNFYHYNCQVEDFNQQGFIIGDPAAPSPQSDSYIFNNLQTWRNSSTIPTPSIGMWLRSAPDALGKASGFVGATTGMQIQSGGAFYDIHNWARASTGVMTTCFLSTSGSCTFVNCQADTATQIGFDLTGTGFVLDACKIYNNNGTTATDNAMVGVQFRTANPQSTVSNLASQGADGTHRIKTDIVTADGTTTGLSIVGSSNVNVVTPIGVASIPTSLNVGDQNSAAPNLTITGSDSSNRQLIYGHQTYPMWIWRCSGSNTGSNQGSNLAMFARTDTGGSLFQAWSIARSTNQWQIADTNTAVTTIHNVYGGGWALKTLGAGLRVAEGTGGRQGISTAMVAGSVAVSLSSIAANSRVVYSRATLGGTPGHISCTVTAGTGFTLTSSSSTETSTFTYQVFDPA